MSESNNKKDQIFKHKKTTNAPAPITPLNTSTYVAHFSSPKIPEHTDKPLDVSELWLISGSDLIDRGLDAQIIVQLILSGELNVLDPYTFKPYDPQDDHYGYKKIAYTAMTRGSFEEQRDALNIKRFRQSDIEELEKRRPDLFMATTHAHQENAKEGTCENAFIRHSDIWHVWFQGKELEPLSHLDGIGYIANIIKHREIHVIDLYNTVHPKDLSSTEEIERRKEVEAALARGDLNVSNMDDEKLDSKAKDSFKKQLAEYQGIIDDPDSLTDEKENANRKKYELTKSICNEYGENPLSHRAPRQQNEHVKKATDTIRKSINFAIKDIEKKSPELAAYLTRNIETRNTCRFKDNSLAWHISL